MHGDGAALNSPSLHSLQLELAGGFNSCRAEHRDIPTRTMSAEILNDLETKPKKKGKNEKEKDKAEWNQAVHVLWEQFGLRAQHGFNEIISHL